jgi:glycosyltransferase involved in cell wall biosynthesis
VDLQLDYLVGGLRISLGAETTTPGPASHIRSFTDALRSAGVSTLQYLSSEQPGLSRLATVREGSGASSKTVILPIADVIRIAAYCANRHRVAKWSRASTANIVYERAAVMSDLASCHSRVRRKDALRVVESNGIFSRETAQDRGALRLEAVARKVEVQVYRSADLVVAVSERLADEICEFAGVDRQKIFVLPNGVPTVLCEMPIDNYPSERIIGFAGALVEWQSLDKLLEAFAQVSEQLRTASDQRSWVVEIVGDGPEQANLANMTRSLRIVDRVRFVPRMPQGQLYNRMCQWEVGFAAHVATSSRSMYHSPLKLYEYAALGLKIVCTDSADAADLRRSYASINICSADTRDVARALVKAAEASNSRFERSERRTRVVENHSWTRRVRDLCDRLESELLARSICERGR